MKLENMSAAKLKNLRAEVVAMIATKLVERRQHLEAELSKLAQIVGERPSPQLKRRRSKHCCEVPESGERLADLVGTWAQASLVRCPNKGRQRIGTFPRRVTDCGRLTDRARSAHPILTR
jgi:hypothetical protein